VSNEYLLAAEHFHLGRAELLALSRESVDVIFGGQEEKERMRGLLLDFEDTYTS
jgi:adenosine deaminase